MKLPKITPTKAASTMATVAFLTSSLFVITTFVGALAGINPDNQGKQLVYPVNRNIVDLLFNLCLASVALSMACILIAIVNLKLKKQTVDKLIILVCSLILALSLFVGWALSGKYISTATMNKMINSVNYNI